MSILELLNIDPRKHRVIAVTGGGGKTNLIFRLAEELVSLGQKVIVTTTTHMAWDRRRPFALDGELQLVRHNLREYGYTVAASLIENNNTETSGTIKKIKALPAGVLEGLTDECNHILIEADGAKRLPLKVPAEWEPVIPEITELVIGVMGLDSLGKTIRDTCHRPEIAASFLGKDISAVVTEADLLKIAESEEGLKKGVHSREYRVYLNKLDMLPSEERADKLVSLLRERGIHGAAGSLKTSGFSVAIVILAAGNSRRFGSNKLLYPIEGISMYEVILKKVSEVRSRMKKTIHSVTVVTQYEEIRDRALELGFHGVMNPHPEEGISSSMRLGLAEALEADACLFMVADQPWIRTDTLARLIGMYCSQSPLEGAFAEYKGIAALSSAGEPGNPCIFGREYYPELLSLRGDKGGKRVLKRHMEDVLLLEASDKKELLDMDTL